MKNSPVPLFLFCLLLPFNAHSVEFTLFGDVVFMDTDAESESSTFNLGGFDLTANQEIGEAIEPDDQDDPNQGVDHSNPQDAR